MEPTAGHHKKLLVLGNLSYLLNLRKNVCFILQVTIQRAKSRMTQEHWSSIANTFKMERMLNKRRGKQVVNLTYNWYNKTNLIL
jgi:uncharacterized hydantoinase/oxoprolinase family protein